jgi:hypothetical protein
MHRAKHGECHRGDLHDIAQTLGKSVCQGVAHHGEGVVMRSPHESRRPLWEEKMEPKSPPIPHFLRVTRALALASGMIVPLAAVTEGCGGAVVRQEPGPTDLAADATPEDANTPSLVGDADSTYDGWGAGTSGYEGGSTGLDAGIPYEGGPVGVGPIPDSGYEGGTIGVDSGEHD